MALEIVELRSSAYPRNRANLYRKFWRDVHNRKRIRRAERKKLNAKNRIRLKIKRVREG